MNDSTFGENYAALYDSLYADKPYDAEVATIRKLIEWQCGRKPSGKNILDVGCGTGNHSLRLMVDNNVTGLDRSEAMLTYARKKAPQAKFVLGDATNFDLDEKFDVVLTMAAVLGYQLKNFDVADTLQCVRKHLNVGGLYIFDVWYGPTVVTIGAGERVKLIENGGTKYIRLSRGQLDTFHNYCNVTYNVWDTATGAEFTESHTMRYFFPTEIEYYLWEAGFRILLLGQCPNIWVLPDDKSWHMMIAATMR